MKLIPGFHSILSCFQVSFSPLNIQDVELSNKLRDSNNEKRKDITSFQMMKRGKYLELLILNEEAPIVEKALVEA